VCFRPVLKLCRSSAFSGESPAMLRPALVIDVSDRPLCFSVRTDQVIVASDWPWCFVARTDPKLLLIDVSDRPWCFSARTDQIVVQVSNEFPTGVKVLFNYLVICFESLYCVFQAIPA
jgi:hypothetical protein